MTRRLLAALLAASAAGAIFSSAEEKAPPASEAGVSLKDATAIVRQAYGGRVLSATTARRDGEPGYRIRVDVDGTVKTLFVDRRGRIHDLAD